MSGGLQFLAWVRDGIAADLPGQSTVDAPLPARGTVPVGVTVNDSPAARLDTGVYGPGDVTGIDSGQIIRVFPAPGTTNAETTSLAHVEFERPDLPWLFTPGGATPEGRLRPWLTLIVVPADTAQIGAATEQSLAGLTCPVDELPDPADSWAWAHAQVALNGPEESVAQVLAESADRALSRIVSARRLRPHRQYLAALVPAFEAGRKAGLGLDLGDDETANLAPAWSAQGAGSVTLPIYHHWTFATGDGGDFESLVRRLTARTMPDSVGMRPMSLVGAGAGLPELVAGAPGSILGLEGALRAPTALPTPWPDSVRAPWHAGMRALLAGGAARLTPPMYGGVHAGVAAMPSATGDPRWLRELNVDPRSRAAAAFGTEVIQRHQEALAASAWEQAAAVRDANELLRRAQLAREVSAVLYRRTLLPPQADPGMVLQLTAPTASGVTAGPRTARTIASDLSVQPTVLAATSGAFRRLTRPRGPLARRLMPDAAAPDANIAHRAAPAGGPDLLSAAAAARIGAVPKLTDPPGMVGIDSVIQAKTSTFQVLGNVVTTAQDWWEPAAYAPAPDLGGVPTTVATGPSDVVSGGQIFVGTADGRLFELRREGAIWRWRDHGKPPGPAGQQQGASVRDTPAVIAGQSRVFVTTKDGRVVQRYWTGDRWAWRDHGKPIGATGTRVDVTSAPVACGAAIFAVTSERVLTQLTWTASSSTWTPQGAPDGHSLIGNPGAPIGGTSLFIRLSSGGLGRLTKAATSWQWTVHPAPVFHVSDLPLQRAIDDNGGDGPPVPNPAITMRTSTDPGAAMGGTTVVTGLKRFAGSAGGSTVGMLVQSGGAWTWSRVLDTESIADAPGAAMLDDKCFAAGPGGHLIEIYRNVSGAWQLIDHAAPPGDSVTGQPGGAVADSVVHVRGTSGALTALEWNGQAWSWATRGVPEDHGGDGGWNAAPPLPRDPDGSWNRNDGTWAAPIGFMSSLVVAHVDNPAGANRVYHRVGSNLGLDGSAQGEWTAQIADPQPVLGDNTAGIGIALADISGNGTLDMLVLTVTADAASSIASYVIGWDLGADGTPARWSPPTTLPDTLGPHVQAVDVTLAPVAGGKRPDGTPVYDVVVAYVTGDGPGESDAHTIFYRIGWSLDDSGAVANGWSDSKDVPGRRPGTVHGIGVAIGDLDDDTLPDIVLVVMEELAPRAGGAAVDQASYQVGHRINRRGNITGGWDPARSMGGQPIWPRHSGLGIALADVSGSRRPDLIVFRIEDRDEENRACYRIGFDLAGGGVRSWSDDIDVPGWFGWANQGGAIALGDLDPALRSARQALAANYAAAAAALQQRIDTAERLARHESSRTVALDPLADRVRIALDPEHTVTARTLPKVTVGTTALPATAPGGTGTPGAGDPLRELTAQVSFPVPAYELLREISQDLILPGIEAAVPDTVTLLRANPGFIEAFLVGLNHEMSRELLWRDFPGDRRTTYFRSFWDARAATGGAAAATDIPAITSWRDDVQLGDNVTDVGAGGEGHLVLLIRGELLRRYPDATITARRAVFGADGVSHDLSPAGADGVIETLPIFAGSLAPDLLFFGFPLSVREARGSATDPGWFFVLREHATAPRFGVDEPPDDAGGFGRAPTTSWRDLDWTAFATDAAALDALRFVPVRSAPFWSQTPVTLENVTWGHNGGHMASALLQLPVQMAIHASDMIPPLEDGWHVSAVSKRTGGDVMHRITAVAGIHADGTPWRLDIDQAIAAVERGEHFYVQLPGEGTTRIVVSHTNAGRRYLRTVADDELPNNLLALPEPADDGSRGAS